jgi:hypothetical protein
LSKTPIVEFRDKTALLGLGRLILGKAEGICFFWVGQ